MGAFDFAAEVGEGAVREVGEVVEIFQRHAAGDAFLERTGDVEGVVDVGGAAALGVLHGIQRNPGGSLGQFAIVCRKIYALPESMG